jgi:hypothetical protein
LKVPLKIKIFVWYLYKGVTLTKNNAVSKGTPIEPRIRKHCDV